MKQCTVRVVSFVLSGQVSCRMDPFLLMRHVSQLSGHRFVEPTSGEVIIPPNRPLRLSEHDMKKWPHVLDKHSLISPETTTGAEPGTFSVDGQCSIHYTTQVTCK